jgi:hypothetical protein
MTDQQIRHHEVEGEGAFPGARIELPTATERPDRRRIVDQDPDRPERLCDGGYNRRRRIGLCEVGAESKGASSEPSISLN